MWHWLSTLWARVQRRLPLRLRGQLLLLVSYALCSVLGLTHLTTTPLLPFFFLAIVTAILAPLPEALVTLVASVGTSFALLEQQFPKRTGVLLQAEAWFAGLGLLVLLLSLLLRHRVATGTRLHAHHAEQARQERLRAEAAEAAVRERDAFLSIAAHELKTPLTSLTGYTELACDLVRRAAAVPVPLPEPYQALAKEADIVTRTLTRQATKMTAMVDRLLDVGRLGTGKLQLDLLPLDLSTVIQEAIGMALTLHPGRTITQQGPERLVLAGDALRLEQVLVNLFDNALKYSPAECPVQLVVEGGQRQVLLAITDYGPGIAPGERARVFERFYQVASRERSTGLGLGLYLTREIVQRHGGSVSLTEAPGPEHQTIAGAGPGTTVLVLLPYVPPHLTPHNPPDVPGADAESPG